MTETDETAEDSSAAPEARHHLARRRYLARLRELAARLDHQAALIRNGGRDPRAETRAGKLADEAFAIRWALRQVAPETETIRQTLDAFHAATITARSQP